MNSFLQKFSKYEYENFGYIKLPEAPVTKKDKIELGLAEDCTNFEFLKELVRKNFKQKTPKDNYQNYVDRTKKELEVIEKLGFVNYYLLIWDICRYADKQGIARDYGRGSIAGSVIAMYLNITNVLPIEHNLYFERFISEARAKKKIINGEMYIDGSLSCDADLDFDRNRRDEIIEYLKSLYPNRVCRISTFNTLTSKLCLKECFKIVSGATEEQAKELSDSVPKLFGVTASIEECLNGIKDDSGEEEKKPIKEIQKWAQLYPQASKTAQSIEGLIKNCGVHPCGQFLGSYPLDGFIPTQFTKAEKEDGGNEEVLVSCFDKESIENFGVKVDLLSARSCTVISQVLKEVNEKLEDINVEDDPIIYDNLQNFHSPVGIFQLEQGSTLKVTQEVKPKNLEELGHVISLSRPGCLSFLKDYVKNDPQPIHPLFDPILSKTHGICIFQETLMALSVAVGFTLVEAETLRRIVGRKKVEEVKEWQSKIENKIKENNLPVETGKLLWKLLKDSANYSFNASHAISFASLSAATIYLKCKYPINFYKALLQNPKVKSQTREEISAINREMHNFNIKLLPPDLIKSEIDFSIEGNDIRFGLSSIKGISEKTIEHLLKFKKPHANRFEVFESAESAGLNTGVLCALIHCGCLDEMAKKNVSRASLALQAQLWNLLTSKEKVFALKIGEKHGYNLFEVFKEMRATKNEKDKLIIPDSRANTILKKYEPKKKIFEMNKENGPLASLYYELTLLGFAYSENLYDIYIQNHPGLFRIEEIINGDDRRVEFMAIISEKPVERTSVAKNKYARFILSDETGSISGMIFNNKQANKLDEIKRMHEDKLPKKDAIVYISGMKKGDCIFIDQMRDQSVKIYTKYWKEESQQKENVE